MGYLKRKDTIFQLRIMDYELFFFKQKTENISL